MARQEAARPQEQTEIWFSSSFGPRLPFADSARPAPSGSSFCARALAAISAQPHWS